MRIATLIGLACMAGTLIGCASMRSSSPGRSVDFVASNPDSVLLDFAARPEGELTVANATADQQCQLFHRSGATLESLNVRDAGIIRGTYRCRN
jgi:hypothetical protein